LNYETVYLFFYRIYYIILYYTGYHNIHKKVVLLQ